MKKQEQTPIRSPEELLARAELLASRVGASATGPVRQPLRPWMRNGLWALGGAGLTGLLWWISLMG